MEDTLRGINSFMLQLFIRVLILVLMEDTLRVAQEDGTYKEGECLNPCSNGRYSQS